MAMLGLAPVDDDAQQLMPKQEAVAPTKTYDPSTDERVVTMPQLKRLNAMMNSNNWTRDQLKKTCSSLYNIDSSKELSRDQYDNLCKLIETSSYGEPESLPEPTMAGVDENGNINF